MTTHYLLVNVHPGRVIGELRSLSEARRYADECNRVGNAVTYGFRKTYSHV